jgi:transcription-repair coupling factor (superfamily II helicase)
VHLRLRLYKRIAAAADRERLSDLEAELVDRFGPLPPPAQTLLRVAALKLRAAPLGIARLEVGPAGGLLRFAEQHKVDPARVIRLVQRDPRRYRLDGSHGLRFAAPTAGEDARLAVAQGLLDELGAAT